VSLYFLSPSITSNVSHSDFASDSDNLIENENLPFQYNNDYHSDNPGSDIERVQIHQSSSTVPSAHTGIRTDPPKPVHEKLKNKKRGRSLDPPSDKNAGSGYETWTSVYQTRGKVKEMKRKLRPRNK
jgi:hypothetical protein